MIISNAAAPLHQRQALHGFFAVINHVVFRGGEKIAQKLRNQ
jgi:hypothetical protein